MPTARINFDLPEVYQMLSTLDGTFPDNGGTAYHAGSGIENGGLSTGVGTDELRDADDATYAQAQVSTTRYGSSPPEIRTVDDGLDVAMTTLDLDMSQVLVSAVTVNIRASVDAHDGFAGIQVFLHKSWDRDAFGGGANDDPDWQHDEVTNLELVDTTTQWLSGTISTSGGQWQQVAFDATLDPQGRRLFVETFLAVDGVGAPIHRLVFLPSQTIAPATVGATNTYTFHFYEGYIEFDYTPITTIDGSVTASRAIMP